MKKIYVFLIFVIFISCQKRPNIEVKTTKELIVEANAKIDPMKITYTLNRERAEIYKQQAELETTDKKYDYLIKYAIEMLFGGHTEESVKTLRSIINIFEEKGANFNNNYGLSLYGALAIAYMRKGEIENCIQFNNHHSCIVPVKNDGIHQLKEGSTEAIKIFEKILSMDSTKFQHIWLLNLAHMTLGTYPEGVPEKYLLPPSYFDKNKGKFPVYHNIAGKLGIDDNRISGGAIMDDFDNDGDLDLIASSWGIFDQIYYYINDGKGSFEESALEKGLEGVLGGLNIQQTDFNNDGFLDFYIMRGAWMLTEGAIPNTLMMNNGDGSFRDVTLELGLDKYTGTQACSWRDLNKDGWLDLLVFSESMTGVDYPTQMWINREGKKFEDYGEYAGFVERNFYKGVSVGDVNNDGWEDVYVSNLQGDNLLYIHQGLDSMGIPKFKEMGKSFYVTGPTHSFPTFMFDFNNDGFNDILVSSFQSYLNVPAADFALNILGNNTGGHTSLYINQGNNTFVDIRESIGMNEAIYTMGCNYGDIDNDGWLDFYLATGDPSFFSIVPNKMYKNIQGQQVMDISFAGGFAHIQKGHGVSMADPDRDGQLDVYAVLGGAYQGDGFQNAFFHNPGNDNNWIVLDFEGTQSNRKAIGARVRITVLENGKPRHIFRTVEGGSSFGANSLELEVGIAKATQIQEVIVSWPHVSGNMQKFENLEINSWYKIKEGESMPKLLDKKTIPFRLDKKHVHHQH